MHIGFTFLLPSTLVNPEAAFTLWLLSCSEYVNPHFITAAVSVPSLRPLSQSG